MENKYNFNTADIPTITLHLLVEILAFQQAAFSHALEMANLTEQEKEELVKDINDALPALKETIIESVYASFGKTPGL